MAFVDIRAPVVMTELSELLLKMAETPLCYVGSLSTVQNSIPSDEVVAAASLARQASATVISNCVLELWSTTVCYLHGIEPAFPLYPKSVVKFVSDTRLSFMSYMSLYYSICQQPFEGTSTAEKAKTIIDLRHELQHDKPEGFAIWDDDRIRRVKKWEARLRPLVGDEALKWLPRVRQTPEATGFTLGGEPLIMKFMKYPIAKWALEATRSICDEMGVIFGRFQGDKKLCPTNGAAPSGKITSDLWRLWYAGE